MSMTTRRKDHSVASMLAVPMILLVGAGVAAATHSDTEATQSDSTQSPSALPSASYGPIPTASISALSSASAEPTSTALSPSHGETGGTVGGSIGIGSPSATPSPKPSASSSAHESSEKDAKTKETPAKDTSEKSPETKGSSTEIKMPLSTQSTQKPSTPSVEYVYIVQNGDTLAAVSGKTGVSLDRLVKANEISDINMIHTGSALVIPSP